MKETIHYIADIRYVSQITSDRYSSKRQVVEEHIRYIEKSANYEFGDKKLVLENTERYNKRVNSRVAGKTVFALPNDIKRNDYEKWCRYIQSVISENFKVNPEYIYIAIHETHDLQEYLNTRNLHAHVVFTPITRDGKAIQTKISDMKALHQTWKQILVKEGYTIRKEQQTLGKLGWKLRKDQELLNTYKEYIQAKKEQHQAEQQAVRLVKESRNRIQFLEVAGQPQQIAEIEIVEPEYPEKPQLQPEAVSKQVLYPNRSEEIYQEAQKTYQSIPEHTISEHKSNITYQNIPEQNILQQSRNVSEQNTVEQKSTIIHQNIPEQREKRKREIQSLLAGKPLGEAIKTVRMLRKSEVDREIQRYLDNILNNLNRKAAEILKQRQSVQKTEPETTSKEKVLSYQNDSKKIAEYIQKPEKSEITTAKEENVQKKEKQPVHREPELPVQRQPQPQPQSQPTRQPQPQRQPIRQPENIAHEREEREKRNFATRIHRIVKIAKEVNSDDVLAMIMSDETNKDEKTARVLAVLYNFVLNKEMKSGKDRHQQTEQQTEETESKQEQKEQKEQNTGLKTNLDKGWWNPGI